jgi:hypothetical protein
MAGEAAFAGAMIAPAAADLGEKAEQHIFSLFSDISRMVGYALLHISSRHLRQTS